MSPIRVFVLDDHEVVRRGIRDLMWLADDIEVVGEAETAIEALTGIARTKPDVALLDVHLGDDPMTGIDVCRLALRQHPKLACLMLSAETSPELVERSVAAGAFGYIAKQIRSLDLVSAVRAAAERHVVGATPHGLRPVGAVPPRHHADAHRSLTGRERDVLHLVATGRTNRQIGDVLGLSEKTVKNNVTNVLTKLGMARRAEAAAYAAAREERALHPFGLEGPSPLVVDGAWVDAPQGATPPDVPVDELCQRGT